MKQKMQTYFKNQEGKIGYIILWLMGVPASLLVVIYLIRGCR